MFERRVAMRAILSACVLAVIQALPARAQSAAANVPVTVDNFVRAESDLYFGRIVKDGALGKFVHNREPTPIDKQTVVRMNRDTLYSSAVFDLDAGPVSISLPNPQARFLSMQIINEDHYTFAVIYNPGRHTLTREEIGTRYVLAAVRIMVDPGLPGDLDQVRKLQDAIRVEQAAPGTFEIPQYDSASQKKVRDALAVLASTIPDYKRAFGTRDRVDPVRHLIGTAAAWGGNPDADAIYLNATPERNDGKSVYTLTVSKVPVEAFWSISVYNREGYFEKNAADAYTINNLTAKKPPDGSITIQFGGCDGSIPATVNCLPITPGWSYVVRLYRPRKEITSGAWQFPSATLRP